MRREKIDIKFAGAELDRRERIRRQVAP